MKAFGMPLNLERLLKLAGPIPRPSTIESMSRVVPGKRDARNEDVLSQGVTLTEEKQIIGGSAQDTAHAKFARGESVGHSNSSDSALSENVRHVSASQTRTTGRLRLRSMTDEDQNSRKSSISTAECDFM